MGLTFYVAIYDAWLLRHRRMTLSQVFGNALKHPRRRFTVIGIWGVLTLHLFGEMLPGFMRERLGKYDPIGILARAIEAA